MLFIFKKKKTWPTGLIMDFFFFFLNEVTEIFSTREKTHIFRENNLKKKKKMNKKTDSQFFHASHVA